MTIGHINLAKGFRGGERQTVLLVNALSHYCRQKLYVRRGSPMADLVEAEVEVVELDKPFFSSLSKLKSCDILHAHEAKASQLAFIAHLLFGIPYYITRRVLFAPSQNLFNRLMYLRASTVFTLSRAIDRTIHERFEGVKTAIIPSAVTPLETTEELGELKRRFGNKFTILHIGALVDSDKGQQIIFDAAEQLRNLYPEMHFVLVGEGADRPIFEQRTREMDNVTLEGFRENLGDYLSVADLFIFPSRNEGLGSILLDAMNFRLPIIASNVGGIPDIVQDGVTGCLIPDGDAEALKDAIIDLYTSDRKREFLANNARAKLEQFRIERLAEQYISHYFHNEGP